MAPMSSMLARAASSATAVCRASRVAALASARAARSAAAALRAAAAVSRAARSTTDAAAADLALGTSSREGRSLRYDASLGAAPSLLRLGSDSVPDEKPWTPKFVADQKDLESDEALWALYERWCKHFNQERDRGEMARRFDESKRVVLLVHQSNNCDRPYKFVINQFADGKGKLSEVCFPGNTDALHSEKLARLAKVPITGSSFIWLDGKNYMELPEEFQPE